MVQTRRKIHSHRTFTKKTLTIDPIIQQLLAEYWDLVVEIQTKQTHFQAELRECMRWRVKYPTFYALKPIKFPTFDAQSLSRMSSPVIKLQQAITLLKQDISKINKEFSYVHAICEVESRSRRDLLHTLPTKKMGSFELVYPNIRRRMDISKFNASHTHRGTPPHIPKRVRFGSKYVRTFHT